MGGSSAKTYTSRLVFIFNARSTGPRDSKKFSGQGLSVRQRFEMKGCAMEKFSFARV
jgi:hypothetical protein